MFIYVTEWCSADEDLSSITETLDKDKIPWFFIMSSDGVRIARHIDEEEFKKEFKLPDPEVPYERESEEIAHWLGVRNGIVDNPGAN